jgi:hypothetical protein
MPVPGCSGRFGARNGAVFWLGVGVGELSDSDPLGEDFRGPRVRRVPVLVGLWGLALGGRSERFGPEPPLATTSKCCSAARNCGHSCRAQHFVGSNVGVRTNQQIAATEPMTAIIL